MKSPFIQEAKNIYTHGMAAIPLRPESKKPYGITEWSKYSNELPKKEDLQSWARLEDANIGLVLGKASGVIGLDFDYDVDGYHDKIFSLLSGVDTVTKVGNKGCTMFFKYNGEKSKGWSVKGERILDLLSDGRYTVMPPSVHPYGDVYKYSTLKDFDDELPELPEDFIDNVDEMFKKQPSTEARAVDIDVSEVKKALKYISSDDYEDWTRVGMALKSSLDEEGFEVWDDWSRSSNKYSNEKENAVKWKSFKGNGIELATLYWMAMQNGFQIEESKVNIEGIVRPNDLISELEDWRKNGIDRGESCGIKPIDELVHFKKGEFFVWTGYAKNGKSEVLDSIALGLMKNCNWKFLYCSLEKMPRGHIQSLVHKITGMPIEDRTREQQLQAIQFLQEHCSVIGRKDFDPSIDNIYKMAKIYKNLYGLDALVIDPFNYISSPHEGNIFQHAGYILKQCTYIAQTLNIHVALVAHPKKPSVSFNDKSGELPRLNAYSVSGSADFANVPDLVAAVYRTDTDLTEIDVTEVRDEDVNSRGSCKLIFDKTSKRHEPLPITQPIEL
jgi:hypothetical protein